MTASSIPKERLVRFICDDLKASGEAARRFRISPETPIPNRLLSFNKPELIAFVQELGPKAAESLRKLESAFPLHRPPTLYLAVIDQLPDAEQLRTASLRLAKRGRASGLVLPEDGPIRFIYLPEATTTIPFNKTFILEVRLHYERRVDIICSEVDADNYGQACSVYSLETALIWLPFGANHKHGVVACCDYPAVRHILRYLRSHVSLSLTLPYLDTTTIFRLTAGATPRSVTFHTDEAALDRVQNVTLSDPLLSVKQRFLEATQDDQQEQTAGFYSQHPGLAGGGLGIARRDGKVWTPKRLDHKSTAALALNLIEQTERELAKVTQPAPLLKHYYGSHVSVGDKELTGQLLRTWQDLVAKVLEARQNRRGESTLEPDLLRRLIEFQHRLGLSASLTYDCPDCGVSSFAVCPTCDRSYQISFAEDWKATCPKCKHTIEDGFECECKAPIEFADYSAACRLIPEPELVDSIVKAAERVSAKPFRGFFVVRGTIVKVIERHAERKAAAPPRLKLSELKLWQDEAKLLGRHITETARQKQLIPILSQTKEKCLRDGKRPSHDHCATCNEHPLNPQWIVTGETCLLRLFGVAINAPFDGVHHGQELADLKYDDHVVATGKKYRIGIHVKSRDNRPPAQGMGRSKDSIKGLYTQLAYSAFRVREGGEKLDVLGVAMPNIIHPAVIASLEFVANQLGFPFLVIDENDWLKIIDAAVENTDFDNIKVERDK